MKNIFKIAYKYYITSDEEIKKGDWCLSLSDDESYEEIYRCKDVNLIDIEDRKIIITSDADLIADGIQAINYESLKWMVENQTCKTVEIGIGGKDNTDMYVIILPTKPMGDLEERFKRDASMIVVPKDYYDQDSKDFEQASLTDFIDDETLEEFIDKVDTPSDFDQFTFDEGIRVGAKWQAERIKEQQSYLQGFIDQFGDGKRAELNPIDWNALEFLEWLKLNNYEIIKNK